MTIKLWWSDKIPAMETRVRAALFVQRMFDRLMQGEARYGPANRKQQYMTRLIMEVKAYKKYGNVEHLYNAANYCVLESMEPENKKFHYDPTVESVTNKAIGV